MIIQKSPEWVDDNFFPSTTTTTTSSVNPDDNMTYVIAGITVGLVVFCILSCCFKRLFCKN